MSDGESCGNCAAFTTDCTCINPWAFAFNVTAEDHCEFWYPREPQASKPKASESPSEDLS